MARGNRAVREYLEHVSDFAAKVRSRFQILLGARSWKGLEYDSLPHVSKSILAETVTVQAMGSGWWRVCGRYRDCARGYRVSVEVLAENTELSHGRALGLVQEEALRYFSTASCPSCYFGDGVEELPLRLQARGECDISQVEGE